MAYILAKWSKTMKRFLKIVLPIFLVLILLGSLGWYFLIYDQAFTQDQLVSAAQHQEQKGNYEVARWLYGVAYRQTRDSESVAIALANQYLSQGNYTKAEYTLSNAIADGGDSQLYIALCSVYVAQDKLLDAVNMLEQITDPAIKAELDALRPAAPSLTPDPGFYNQFLSVSVSSDSGTLYVSRDGEYPSTAKDLYTGPLSLDLGETTLYALSVGEDGLVSPLVVCGYTIGGIVEPVVFSDPVIEKAVRALLVNADQTIFTNELWEITELQISDAVGSWEDLRHFTGLTSLSVHDAELSDLSFLRMLPKLQKLDLSGCRFPAESLQFIAECSGLRSLRLNDCQLSTSAALEPLTELEELDLGNNSLRDLSALEGMTHLKRLELQHNAISYPAELTRLTELEELDLSYNEITSASALQSCTSLNTLDLSQNAISSVASLRSLTSLTWLNLSSNDLTDVSPLSEMPSLKYLDISHNQVEEITSLSSLTKLENFFFSHNQVTQLPEWPADCALIRIDGAYNVLETLDPLSGLQHLNFVVMDYNELTNVDSLAECPMLVQVDIFGNQVPQVSALTAKDIVVNYDPTQRDNGY